jgi:hypothetical protein
MIASLHVADVGVFKAVGTILRPPKPGTVPGLRHAETMSMAPFSGKVLIPPDFKRVGLIAFWDDDESLDKFLKDEPWAARFAGGWHVRLQPVRVTATWPGFPEQEDIASDTGGPTLTMTIGKLRMVHILRFRRYSAIAERRLTDAEGLIWASGLARLPIVVSCSFWEDTESLMKYAYGVEKPGHRNVLEGNDEDPFHHKWASIRSIPYQSVGELGGKNPLPASALAGVRD